jgi:hypothetical protein
MRVTGYFIKEVTIMYKPDDEKLEDAVEDACVLQEKDINETETPIDQPPEAQEEQPVQESE